MTGDIELGHVYELFGVEYLGVLVDLKDPDQIYAEDPGDQERFTDSGQRFWELFMGRKAILGPGMTGELFSVADDGSLKRGVGVPFGWWAVTDLTTADLRDTGRSSTFKKFKAGGTPHTQETSR